MNGKGKKTCHQTASETSINAISTEGFGAKLSKLKLAERYPVSKELTNYELAEAERRYDDILSRHSKSRDRLVTGGLAINAASATAVFAGLQAGQDALALLGVPIATAATSLGIFVAGVVVGAIGHWVDQIVSMRWAADLYSKRLAPLRNKRAMLEKDESPESLAKLREMHIQIAPPQDFRTNFFQIALYCLSGSIWIGGVCNIAWPVWQSTVSFPLPW